MIITDQINSSVRDGLIETLLSKHCHHHQKGLRAKSSTVGHVMKSLEKSFLNHDEDKKKKKMAKNTNVCEMNGINLKNVSEIYFDI